MLRLCFEEQLKQILYDIIQSPPPLDLHHLLNRPPLYIIFYNILFKEPNIVAITFCRIFSLILITGGEELQVRRQSFGLALYVFENKLTKAAKESELFGVLFHGRSFQS
jgi:hypothetical protein